MVEMARRMCRGGEAELEAPPPWERTRLEAASPWRGRCCLRAVRRPVSPRRMRVVEVREASAAAVAKALCEPSEFHCAVCLCSPRHILQYMT